MTVSRVVGKEAAQRFRVVFEIDQEAIAKLKKFMEREGITSMNIAGRAAMLAGLSEYPHWEILSVKRQAVMREIYRWTFAELATKFNEVRDDLETQMARMQANDILASGGEGGSL